MTAKIVNIIGKAKERVATLPAGTYWIGDPCYFVPDELWMEYLEANNGVDQERMAFDIDGLTVQLSDGRHVASHYTAWGDGCYEGSDGFEYGVDAGMLGAVQVLDTDIDQGNERLGTKVTFDRPFTVSRDGGTVIIGSIRIETDEDEGDDYGWDNDYNEEDDDE